LFDANCLIAHLFELHSNAIMALQPNLVLQFAELPVSRRYVSASLSSIEPGFNLARLPISAVN